MPAFDAVEAEVTGDAPEHQDADHEAEVADAVGEEGLLRGLGARSLSDTSGR